tara:strand:+ start:1096 stop:1251 length:156 start_codon:yes stop_codon:yes gene_type:complete
LSKNNEAHSKEDVQDIPDFIHDKVCADLDEYQKLIFKEARLKSLKEKRKTS